MLAHTCHYAPRPSHSSHTDRYNSREHIKHFASSALSYDLDIISLLYRHPLIFFFYYSHLYFNCLHFVSMRPGPLFIIWTLLLDLTCSDPLPACSQFFNPAQKDAKDTSVTSLTCLLHDGGTIPIPEPK